MKKLLLFASGVNLDILNRPECRSDEARFVGIGGAVVATAFLGWLSSAYALYSIFESYPIATAVGFVWGCVVFNLDRFIVSVMRKRTFRPVNDSSAALVRIVLALFLGYVISYPLKLKVFESEVAVEMQVMAQEKQDAFKSAVAAKYREELNRLQAENEKLQAEIEQAEANYKELTRSYLAEADGSAGTGRYGCGPVCRAKRAAAEAAGLALQKLNAKNDPTISRNRARINEITAHIEAEAANWGKGNGIGYSGLLARIEAMERLKQKESAIWWASWLLVALLMTIETAPILIKMFSAACSYDFLLEMHENRLHDRVQLAINRMHNNCQREHQILVTTNQNMVETERKANEQLSRLIAQTQLELAQEQLQEFKQSASAKMISNVRV
jgi:Skp family chaperone for outer membrane proteins